MPLAKYTSDIMNELAQEGRASYGFASQTPGISCAHELISSGTARSRLQNAARRLGVRIKTYTKWKDSIVYAKVIKRDWSTVDELRASARKCLYERNNTMFSKIFVMERPDEHHGAFHDTIEEAIEWTKEQMARETHPSSNGPWVVYVPVKIVRQTNPPIEVVDVVRADEKASEG